MSSPTRPGDPIAVMPDLFGHPRQPPCLTCPGIPPFPSSPARPGIPSCLWQGARRAPWGGAPRSAQPPEAAYSGGGAKISLSPLSIMCQYPLHLTFKFYSTISGQNVLNRNLKFALGNKKPRFCTRPQPPSSHLGTNSPDFVLNWILKFAVGKKKPRFCTQPEPQVRTWEQKGLFSYSTGTSSSYLGTKSLDFVLNRNLNEMLQA